MGRPRIFYGWWVALAFCLIVFLSTGLRFTVGPFLKPVVGDLGLDRGSFSLVISLSLFLYGAFMPVVGRLVDRFGSRLVVTAGTLVLALALAATGRAPDGRLRRRLRRGLRAATNGVRPEFDY